MSTRKPSAFIVVAKLRAPDANEPDRRRRRVEHVLSGRRPAFPGQAPA